MQWWDEFWKWAETSQLGANVVGGLIVAAVVGVVTLIIAATPKLREPVSSVIHRAWAFLTSIRVTTTKQIEAGKKEAFDEGSNAIFTAALGKLKSGEGDQRTLRQILTGKSPEPTKIDVPTLAKMDPPRLQPWTERPAVPAPDPEPVSWSARMRPNGRVILTNLSKTETALHVTANSGGLMMGWGNSSPSWDEVGPGATVEFAATANPGRRIHRVSLRVVWEDEDRRAYEESVALVGI